MNSTTKDDIISLFEFLFGCAPLLIPLHPEALPHNPKKLTISPSSKIAYNTFKDTPTWPRITPPPTTLTILASKPWLLFFHAHPNCYNNHYTITDVSNSYQQIH